LRVIIGVKPDGSKERVAIGDGYRETKASRLELLLDLKKRGLNAGPRPAVGDGAMGFWAALEEMFPATRPVPPRTPRSIVSSRSMRRNIRRRPKR
jgi:transposase-like protein